MTTITTAKDLPSYPPGTVFTDPTGGVWMIDGYRPDGTGPFLRPPERGPHLAADIIDQYGPLTLQWRPDQPPATVETVMAYDLGVQDGQREPATVKPSVDKVTLVARDVHLYDGGENAAITGPHARRIADAVLALLPGRTEAEVLRDAANRLGDEAASSDYLADHLSDDGLAWIVRKLREYADEQEG